MTSDKTIAKETSGLHHSRKPTASLFFQPKLAIGQADDSHEHEADATAEKVMRMPPGQAGAPFFSPQPISVTSVQRKCAACEEEEKHVQMKSEAGSAVTTVPVSVNNALASSGHAMDTSTRTFMESRFGHDFGHVRVHNDSLAHQSSKDIKALAYAHDNHLVFGAGQYQPNTYSGKTLIAHELTHVLQQGKGIRRYRDPASEDSIHFGKKDTATLKEESFNKKRDKETKPWIEWIVVTFSIPMPDKNGVEAWVGLAKASYYNNAAKLPDVEFTAVAGPEGRGKTRAGTFTVNRIEGVGYNSSAYSEPYERAEERGWGRRYSKNLSGNMNYAVFFTPKQALHAGPKDQCSHGCIHVDWDNPALMQQINYHSVVGLTKVKITYP